MNMPLLSDFLANSAKRHAEKTALHFGDRTYTYRELYQQAASLADYLHANGLKKGDRVIIYLENSPETVISIFGTLMAGGAFSVVNQSVKANKFLYIINNCTPAFIITDRAKTGMLAQFKERQEIPSVITVDGCADISVPLEDIVRNEAPAPDVRMIDSTWPPLFTPRARPATPRG